MDDRCYHLLRVGYNFCPGRRGGSADYYEVGEGKVKAIVYHPAGEYCDIEFYDGRQRRVWNLNSVDFMTEDDISMFYGGEEYES